METFVPTAIGAGASAYQLRQLGEVARHPPCLVHGQHSGGVRIVVILTSIEIGEGLAVGINHLEDTSSY